MSSTNKTTNYQLSHYVGTDKPTYLGDYNSDMNKIDTAMKANADSASQAQTTANSANSLAGQANTKAENAQEDANTAQTTASNALAKALTNETDISNIKADFNLNVITQFNNQSVTVTNGSVIGGVLTLAKGANNNFFKLYGAISINNISQTDFNQQYTLHTNLVINNEYTIDGVGLFIETKNTGVNSIYRVKATMKTNGDIVLDNYVSTAVGGLLVLFPCLYINKNFGDT